MRPTVPRLKSLILPATAIAAAAALALLLTLAAIRPAAAQSARPQLQGSITIANGAQATGAYLGIGDVIWFKIRPSKDLEPISVTPGISDANHFHFAYASGGAAQQAKLAGIASDSAGQFLLYQHTIAAGNYTGGDGNLYFRNSPAPAVSAHLQAADGSGQFNFNAPADNAALSGSARVAAAGNNYIALAAPPAANIHNTEVVNPPGSGWYRPGDVITLRVIYSKRLVAIPNPAPKIAQNRLLLSIGANADHSQPGNHRNAYLTRVGNSGSQGYIEYQYPAQAGDSDPDGIQFLRYVASTSVGSHVCPEVLGPGCNRRNSAIAGLAQSGIPYNIASTRIAGPELAWSDAAQTEITLAQNVAFPKTGDYNAIGGVTGAVAGYPIIYSAASNLPAGLKLGDHNGRAVIYGTPTATSTGQAVTITAADTTGRQAEIAVTITVNEFVQVNLPDNTDGRYNFVSYLQGRNRGGGQLPEATGSAPITYALTQRDGSALPLCVGYNGDAGQPGFLSVNTDFTACLRLTSRETLQLRFTATGPDGQTAAIDLSFTIDPGAHPTNPDDVRSGAREIQDMDANDNGLIEITTPEQLMAIRHDTDGDGNPTSNLSLTEYFALPLLEPYGGFHGSPTAIGCPDTGCIGYELANDIDLNQLEAWWKYADSFQILTNVKIDDTHTVQPWNAIFDGNGYTITGVNFQQPGKNAIGLFGVIGPNGVVRNLGLVNPNNRGDQSVGAIAGINHGTIENVYVLNGTVAADSSTAGLIAGENYGRIRNFWATGSVNTALGAGAAVGGNYGAGAVSHGWTDGFTEQNAPLGGSQGFTYLTGYSVAGSAITAAREIDARAATAGDNVRTYLTTDAGLQAATAAAGFTAVWDAAIWDFGDNCQRPVLKSAGHTTAKQSDARQSACAAE